MKKQRPEKLAFFLKRAKWQELRRKRFRLLRRAKRIAKILNGADDKGEWVTLYNNGNFEFARFEGNRKAAPAKLNLFTNYEESIGFIRMVREGLTAAGSRSPAQPNRKRRRASAKGPKVIRSYWDFTTIEEMSPNVALMLAAEYDRARRVGGWIPKAVSYERWKPNVRSLLNGIGFLELVGIHDRGDPYLDVGNSRILRFRSGDEANGERVDELLQTLTSIDHPELYDAIIEALTNTLHHAYPPKERLLPDAVRSWWLSGMLDRKSGRLIISAYDQGLTIPGTLHTWSKYRRFSRAFKRLFRVDPDPADTSRDGAAIALAMSVGKTSTGREYRGRGLPAIEEPLELSSDGQIVIYSRCGEYRRRKGQRGRVETHATPVNGTLVIWDLIVGGQP